MLSIAEALESLHHAIEPPSVDDFVYILKKCREKRSLAHAQDVHVCLCMHGLDSHGVLRNHLIPTYVECGSISYAQQAFDRSSHLNEHAWTSLIQGYIECGDAQHAFNLYHKMQDEGVQPSEYTFTALLKACARLKSMAKGQEIHTDIAKEGYGLHVFVGSTLVDMYAKCGSLVEARDVFDELSHPDVVSWTALIAGYADLGLGKVGLDCCQEMIAKGVSPNAFTFICCVKACGGMGAVNSGREIHAQIVKEGFEVDSFVGSSLIDMYAKCGALVEAWDVFDKLLIRDVVLWNTLIASYTEHGLDEEALSFLERMPMGGVLLDAGTFVCGLKVCGRIGAIERGQELHLQIVKQGFEIDCTVGNILVDMYAKCGLFAEALKVFDELPTRDAISWTAVMVAFAEEGLAEEVLDHFKQMQVEKVSPDAVMFVSSLKACRKLGALDKGRELHAELIKYNYERDSFIASTLVDMYGKCGSLAEAQVVFDKLQARDAALWNTLITGYAEQEFSEEALDHFLIMQLEGVSPDAVSYVCILKACGSPRYLDRGRELFNEIAEKGYEKDSFIGNALVNMYATCGSLAEAHELFDRLPVRDAISWTGLIIGYAQHGLLVEAINCLKEMQLEGLSLDTYIYVCILKACGSIGVGQQVYTEIVKNGDESDYFVCSSLMEMYIQYGLLADAHEVLSELPVRGVTLWNTVLAGYAEHGLAEDGLQCLQQMQLEGVSPDTVSWNTVMSAYAEQGESEKVFYLYAQIQEQGLAPDSMIVVSILKACGTAAALKTGKRFHTQFQRAGKFEANVEVILATALIDMYGKCGSMVDAQKVFDAMPSRLLVPWNALIMGYARQGEDGVVLNLYTTMREEGVQPDGVTFLCVLTACNHAGLLDKGQDYFEAMREDCSIGLTVKHLCCMIDLLGRAGQLDEAVAMAETMPLQPSLVVWNAVLSACQKWGKPELGRQAFEYAVGLEEKHSAAFILMSNMYADAQKGRDKVLSANL